MFTVALGGHRWLFSPCIRTQCDYARCMGFDCAVVRHAFEPSRAQASAWLKVPLLISALRNGYDAVGYFDADCEVRAHTPDFRAVFDGAHAEAGLAMAPGHSGRLNSGVIFARATGHAIGLLERIVENAERPVPTAERTTYENGHFIHYATGHPALLVIPHDRWNNNSRLNPSSYVQHYSGGAALREWYLKHRSPFVCRCKMHRAEHHVLRLLDARRSADAMTTEGLRERLGHLTRIVARQLPCFSAEPGK